MRQRLSDSAIKELETCVLKTLLVKIKLLGYQDIMAFPFNSIGRCRISAMENGDVKELLDTNNIKDFFKRAGEILAYEEL